MLYIYISVVIDLQESVSMVAVCSLSCWTVKCNIMLAAVSQESETLRRLNSWCEYLCFVRAHSRPEGSSSSWFTVCTVTSASARPAGFLSTLCSIFTRDSYTYCAAGHLYTSNIIYMGLYLISSNHRTNGDCVQLVRTWWINCQITTTIISEIIVIINEQTLLVKCFL